MVYTAFLGIDPGKGGAACLITPHDIEFFDWPESNNYAEVFDKIRSWRGSYYGELFAHLEKVSAYQGSSATGNFQFGANFGAWNMLLASLAIPFQLVQPKAWQKAVGITNQDGPDTKARAFNVASRLFPQAIITGPRGGIKDGRADALLIAHSARLAAK